VQIKGADGREADLVALRGLLERPDINAATRQRVEREIRIVNAGVAGEREAAYEIEFHYGTLAKRATIHDLRLEVGGRVAQIDHLPVKARDVQLEEVCAPQQDRIGSFAWFRDQELGHQDGVRGLPPHDALTRPNIQTASRSQATWPRRQGREVDAERSDQLEWNERVVRAGIDQGRHPDARGCDLDRDDDDGAKDVRPIRAGADVGRRYARHVVP